MANDWRERIVADPHVMLGKPLVRGTRITVELILEKLAAGESVDDLLAAYPRLARDDVQAALAYAAETLRSATIVGNGAAPMSAQRGRLKPETGAAPTDEEIRRMIADDLADRHA
jgi:uncharacterized protein (DUF433 family)